MVELIWLGYVALAFYCAHRAWQVSRALQATALRRLLASVVLAAFLAPSLIPAGHGAGLGPALVAGAVWHDPAALPKVMLLPMVATAAVFFALASLRAWLAGRVSTAAAPAAHAVANPPVGRNEAIATALLLLIPPLGFAVLWFAHGEGLRIERESRDAAFVAQARAEMDRTTVGRWGRESASSRWVLDLSHGSGLDAGVTLPRVPVTGEVLVLASPGTLAPGVPVVFRSGEGKVVGSATADANGAFEARFLAKKDDYLRVVPVRIGGPRARTNPIAATPVVAEPRARAAAGSE